MFRESAIAYNGWPVRPVPDNKDSFLFRKRNLQKCLELIKERNTGIGFTGVLAEGAVKNSYQRS